jgi:hypothetical protein
MFLLSASIRPQARVSRLAPLRWRVNLGDIRQPRHAAPCRYTAQRELEGIISARGFRLEMFPAKSTDVKAHLGSKDLDTIEWPEDGLAQIDPPAWCENAMDLVKKPLMQGAVAIPSGGFDRFADEMRRKRCLRRGPAPEACQLAAAIVARPMQSKFARQPIRWLYDPSDAGSSTPSAECSGCGGRGSSDRT